MGLIVVCFRKEGVRACVCVVVHAATGGAMPTTAPLTSPCQYDTPQMHTFIVGYNNLPEKTAEAIDENGYFHSGDIGKMEGGFVYILDRLKDLIIRGGEVGTGKNLESSLVYGGDQGCTWGVVHGCAGAARPLLRTFVVCGVVHVRALLYVCLASLPEHRLLRG